MNGAAEIDRCSEVMEDGWANTLGDSNVIDNGTLLLLGIVLGYVDG